MSRRQEESLFELLVALPWWINFCISLLLLLVSRIIASSSNPLHATFAPAIGFVGIFFFVVGIASGIITYVEKWKKAGLKKRLPLQQPPEQEPPEAKKYYYEKTNLFTKGESVFLEALDVAAGNNYRVFGKVRIADLLTPSRSQHPDFVDRNIARSKIDRKHVDFVLCDPVTHRPIIGIELDDKSHNSAKSQKKDAVKNQAFELAGVPLLRIPAEHSYDIDKIRRSIMEAAGEEPNASGHKLKKKRPDIPIRKDPKAVEVQYKFD